MCKGEAHSLSHKKKGENNMFTVVYKDSKDSITCIGEYHEEHLTAQRLRYIIQQSLFDIRFGDEEDTQSKAYIFYNMSSGDVSKLTEKFTDVYLLIRSNAVVSCYQHDCEANVWISGGRSLMDVCLRKILYM